MSLLGILLGRPGTAAPPPAPPVPPAPTAGSTPVAAADPGTGAGAGSTANGGSGSSSGAPAATAPPAAEPPAAARPAAAVPAPATGGTPITAPATRHAFTLPEAPRAAEDRERAFAIESQRKWRMSDIVAAIGGGPRAQLLIEAASRPGPVQPGSLIEAIKALRPAPTPPSTRTV